MRRWEIDGYGYWTVACAATEGIIGFGGVERQTLRDRDVLNLYYRFTPGVRRQGYATELAQTAVGFAQA